MNISSFFIKRPIFAGVISFIIFLSGLISLFQLPVSMYPEVVPPSIVVTAQFPGANPKAIAEMVATPLEEEINGVENMLYMSSKASSDGIMTLTVTFRLGTDPNVDLNLVQNRVDQALPRLPDVTQRIGVKTIKSSSDITIVVHLSSPHGRYDMLYLRNYATLNVKDQLAKIEGVGQVQLFGSGDYAMRIWLNPQKIAERGLTAAEVVAAVRSQNVPASAGVIGGPPYKPGTEIQAPISIDGRLQTPEQFGEIIIKTDAKGVITRLKDVARIQMDASVYGLRSQLDNKYAMAMVVFQLPGSNAIDISNRVRATMKELSKSFPDDLTYTIVYDPTVFVRDSIKAVVHTLLEALFMVALVVIVFLQTWRASVIPLLAVPVAIVGTFAVMKIFGGTINVLSLFGLVLAIGIVVDDAIVVVENVERNIRNGLAPRDATNKAMTEVTSPIVAITLVLCSVFFPIAFISGLTGQFYKQFALTIAFSAIISAFNSLTFTPALASLLFKGHGEKGDALTRGMNYVFGGFFKRFNHAFERSSVNYGHGIGRIVRWRIAALIMYAALIGLTYFAFLSVPTGFVPAQDAGYLVGFTQLPAGANLDRTERVIRQMGSFAANEPGITHAVQFPGLSINGFIDSPSAGIAFFALDSFDKRKHLTGFQIAQKLQEKFNTITDGYSVVFPPPPVQGLGTIGGFKLEIEDHADLGYEALDQAVQQVIGKASKAPELAKAFTSYQINTPQLFADLDRTKAEQLDVNLQDVFDTIQIYLGSYYINDFNDYGRTYEVIAEADDDFRSKPDDLLRLKVRNSNGEMVPLGAMIRIRNAAGPETAMRYNAFRAADINGVPAPGYSTGQAQAA